MLREGKREKAGDGIGGKGQNWEGKSEIDLTQKVGGGME